jgi:nitroreductase
MRADVLAEVIRRRRTSLLMDPERSVDDAVIEHVCELATWAPNHKRTWPWRFAVFTGTGRDRLGMAFADDLEQARIADDAKVAKTRTKYRRAPVVVVVGCDPHQHPTFHDENRDAVAAGIQNLLLGATAAGLASFWSTAPALCGPATLELCGFAPETRIIGVVYLGWPSDEAPTPPRPGPSITRITD